MGSEGGGGGRGWVKGLEDRLGKEGGGGRAMGREGTVLGSY